MFSSRDAYESDFCPVRDELLGEMYRASESGLPRLVESVSPDARAKLALFCYRRSHLHSLAVAIATARSWRCSAIAAAICIRWRSRSRAAVTSAT